MTKKSIKTLFKSISMASFLLVCTCGDQKEYDIVILNGTVYDGSGVAPIVTDIAIKDSVIVAMEDLENYKATQEINAEGLAVAPGFIDMHAHLEPIVELNSCESHVRQGVTTALGGPDGSSPYPLKPYMDSLTQKGIGMNVAYLVGHNTIRKNIMKLVNRAPTQEELRAMEAEVDSAMKDGAFGISTGLKYLPGAFSKVDEVIALSKVASKYGGIYTSHLREEGLGLFDAVAEAIKISEDADIPVVLTHHKAIGKPMWGKSSITLGMVDSARSKGLDIKMDQYPYAASYTSISVLIPSWARAGGQESFKRRIADPVLKDSIKNGIVFNILNDRGGSDLDRIQFGKVKWAPELEGKTLKYWCKEHNLEPSTENGAELVIKAQLNGGAGCVFHAMAEEDVENIMKHPFTMIGSDGRLVQPGTGHPHPRGYGTFPRVLGKYVREKKTLTLPTAIRKMTSMPAKSLHLTDRGLLKEGLKADITIFNPKTVIDKATFENPHQYSQGISYVIINGVFAVYDGQFKDVKSGTVLRKQ